MKMQEINIASNWQLDPIQSQTDSRLIPSYRCFITISILQNCFEGGGRLRAAAHLSLVFKAAVQSTFLPSITFLLGDKQED